MLVYSVLDLCLFGTSLFCIGLSGILINRKSLINMLMCLEISLLGMVFCFSAYSQLCLLFSGHLISLLVLVVAASESAIGLALVVLWYQTGESLNVLKICRLKG